MNDLELAETIRKAALDCGFDACGIIKTNEMHGYAAAIDERIAHFPDAKPMFAYFSFFARPEEYIPWAKSIVVCTRSFDKYRIPENLRGIIAKYFCVDTRKDELSKENQETLRFEKFLTNLGLTHAAKHDYGITALRWAGAKAGIGIVRKNNFFYTEKGPWNFLEAFAIDRELELKNNSSIKKCPEKCAMCIEVCPTGSLSKPFQMNCFSCVAFLTSRSTCAPGKDHYDKCGSWIFGCDVCQDVCPFNKKKDWDSGEDFPGLEELAGMLSYERILSMDEGTMRGLLSQKFWYIEPDGVWKWKCNVLNAMRNGYDEKYLPHIERAMDDPREEVRDMAKWVFDSVSTIPSNPYSAQSIL